MDDTVILMNPPLNPIAYTVSLWKLERVAANDSIVHAQVPTTMREVDDTNHDWLLPSQRQTPEWAGLKYGPQSSAWGGLQGALSMAPTAIDTANLSALCPGAMSPA